MAAEILPNVLMLLIGGTLADRYRRDRLLQMASLGSGACQAGIAAIVLTGSSPYWMFPLAVTSGVIAAVAAPANRGILPELVDKEAVQQANAYLSTSRSAAKLVGPAVAGILAATLRGGWAIALDAVSFFVAAAFLFQVQTASCSPASPEGLITQLRAGWAYFRRRRWIWSVTAAFTLINPVQMAAWRVLGPIIAEHTFGAADWGLTLSAQAVGLLAASLVMLRLRPSRPLAVAVASASAVGLPMVALGQKLALGWLMTAALIAGCGSEVSGIAWTTSLQQAVPGDRLSRVMAFDDFGSFATIPLGLALAIPAANWLGLSTVETLGGLVWMVGALLPLGVREVRHMKPEDLQSLALAQTTSLLG
jgi:hypothetical protein